MIVHSVIIDLKNELPWEKSWLNKTKEVKQIID